ncbi:MarR family winged helix-turn-helix transcriptional regulator [Nocardioides sp. SYSU D00038]|uniref:MarR family winged helix-turn-helix transcriptional regulator n=1 Tax=Nocardioides sp. SYSU D00038 TaxID=2812554 RepID=UPI0027DCB4B6|nr:MarR family winged helix-turn-helix transcriptional regulator [Nocardioides sp. SYSU D00038]
MAQSTQPPAVPRDLGILVLLAYQGFVRGLHEEMAVQGYDDLGHADGVMFRMLHVAPQTVSVLAGKLGISKQGTAQIVDDMEARGYVVRRPDPADARARLVELSARGRAALGVARAYHAAYEERLVGQYGEGALAGVRTVLEGMAGSAPTGLDKELRSLYL